MFSRRLGKFKLFVSDRLGSQRAGINRPGAPAVHDQINSDAVTATVGEKAIAAQRCIPMFFDQIGLSFGLPHPLQEGPEREVGPGGQRQLHQNDAVRGASALADPKLMNVLRIGLDRLGDPATRRIKPR